MAAQKGFSKDDFKKKRLSNSQFAAHIRKFTGRKLLSQIILAVSRKPRPQTRTLDCMSTFIFIGQRQDLAWFVVYEGKGNAKLVCVQQYASLDE